MRNGRLNKYIVIGFFVQSDAIKKVLVSWVHALCPLRLSFNKLLSCRRKTGKTHPYKKEPKCSVKLDANILGLPVKTVISIYKITGLILAQ